MALAKLADKYGYDVDILNKVEKKLLELEVNNDGQELECIEKHFRLLRLENLNKLSKCNLFINSWIITY